MKVLVVEDTAFSAELVRDLLELRGHDCRICSCGASLREDVAAGIEADLVLMDIKLPDADGVALLAELRATKQFATVPIFAFTAQALQGDAERFLAAGFNRVMTKPIDTRTFVKEVEDGWREFSSSMMSR